MESEFHGGKDSVGSPERRRKFGKTLRRLPQSGAGNGYFAVVLRIKKCVLVEPPVHVYTITKRPRFGKTHVDQPMEDTNMKKITAIMLACLMLLTCFAALAENDSPIPTTVELRLYRGHERGVPGLCGRKLLGNDRRISVPGYGGIDAARTNAPAGPQF